MFEHYLLTALRHFAKAKAVTPFGTIDVIGKPVVINGRETVHITGVMKPLYVQKSPLSFVSYLGTLSLCLVIAWLAMFRRAWMAAHLPPAAVLRHE